MGDREHGLWTERAIQRLSYQMPATNHNRIAKAQNTYRTIKAQAAQRPRPEATLNKPLARYASHSNK
jgi:hypothetical protein